MFYTTTDAHNPNIGEESEMPSPPVSHVEDDEPPNLESSSNNGEGCGSSTFEMTTIDGLVIGILLSLKSNIYIRKCLKLFLFYPSGAFHYG